MKQRTTSFTYDDAGHRISTTTPDPAAAPLVSTWDANGNQATASDTQGRTLTYTYNKVNELTAVDGPQGHWEVTRTKLGEIGSITANDGSKTIFTRNAANQIASIDYPGASNLDVDYSYDANGNRKTMSTSAAGTTTYTYDDLDQLTHVTRPDASIAYGYTKSGLLKSLNYPSPATMQVDYTYDNDGRLHTVKRDGTLEATYTYTPTGAVKTADIGTGSGAFQRTFSYDAADRLARLQDLKANSTVILDDNYDYDAADNPTKVTHAGGSADTYTYDVLDRLTGACYGTTSCTGATDFVKWTYDEVGNRTAEIRPTGTSTYDYNATTGRLSTISGNGVNRSFTYNDLGQITGDGKATYTYNGVGRVATETRNGQTTSFNYDGDGQRITATNGSSVTGYSWDPVSHQLLAEKGANGALTAQYLYGVGQLSRTTGNNDTSYYHVDAQGSVRATTDTAGSTLATNTYEPFGVPRGNNPNGSTQPLGFAGEYTDPGGLQHLRARQYDPSTGRFLAPDPAENTGAAANYAYAHSNPMRFSDPSGLWGVSAFAQTLGQGILAAAPTISTVLTIASFTPLAPIAAPLAVAFGAITALDSMMNAVGQCLDDKGSCGQALLTAAGATALGVGAGAALARSAKTAHQLLGARGSVKAITGAANGAARVADDAPIGWPPNNGFHGNLGPHGNPGVTVLKPGTLVDRFGFDGGEFVAPNGTAIGQRSLAPGTTDKPYSVFEVTNRLVVQRGPAEPWFGQPGMGLQYRLPASVEDLLNTGYLRRVG